MSNIPAQANVKVLPQSGWQQSLFVQAVRVNLPFIAIVVVYFAASVLLLPAQDVISAEAFRATASFLLGGIVPIALFGLFIFRVIHVARHERPEHPVSAVAKDFWRVVSNPYNLVLSVPVFLLAAQFFRTYVAIKSRIPDINPFSWDTTFYQWDKIVHFGMDPWKIVDPVISLHPWLTFLLSFNYLLWFLFLMVIWGIYVFGGKYQVLRTRFLLTFFLTWAVGGSLFGIVFSSVGPAFYGGIGLSPDPYVELLQQLRATAEIVPVSSVGLQNKFLSALVDNNVNLGISAMPSIHNAIALLMVIGAWQINRKFGYLMAVHCFLIYVASFYLAWHYAIDAYAGWAVTLMFWYISGYFARWWHARPFMQEFDAWGSFGRSNRQ